MFTSLVIISALFANVEEKSPFDKLFHLELALKQAEDKEEEDVSYEINGDTEITIDGTKISVEEFFKLDKSTLLLTEVVVEGNKILKLVAKTVKKESKYGRCNCGICLCEKCQCMDARVSR